DTREIKTGSHQRKYVRLSQPNGCPPNDSEEIVGGGEKMLSSKSFLINHGGLKSKELELNPGSLGFSSREDNEADPKMEKRLRHTIWDCAESQDHPTSN
ncbi:hypothetical protein C922_05652, partial [Plasmodium inui San Antonio 1]